MKKYELLKTPTGEYPMPTQEWAEELSKLFDEHVKQLQPEIGWKGPCEAVVPTELRDDVTEAMNHVGALVDLEEDHEDGVRIFSKGYLAHGFEG